MNKTDWLTNWLTDWRLTDQLSDWLTNDLPTNRLAGWLTDWSLMSCAHNCVSFLIPSLLSTVKPQWSICSQSQEIQMTMAWRSCWCTITIEPNEKPFVDNTLTWWQYHHMHTAYSNQCLLSFYSISVVLWSDIKVMWISLQNRHQTTHTSLLQPDEN